MSLEELRRKAKEIAEVIRNTRGLICIITHVDTDGITSGAIAAKAMVSLKKRFVMFYCDSLNQKVLDKALSVNPRLVWMTDIGSAGDYLQLIEKTLLEAGIPVVITDHHATPDLQSPNLYHLNSNLYNVDGLTDACGASVTYSVAKHLVSDPADLAQLVIVGATGDRQADTGLSGLNLDALKLCEERKSVERHIGLKIYGRSTQSLFYALAYSSSFDIPEFSKSVEAVLNFLGRIGIKVMNKDGSPRTFVQLTKEEKERLNSEIAMLMARRGFTPEQIRSGFGEYYSFPNNDPNTPLYFADEFSILLNGCSRGAGRTDLAIGLAMGNLELYNEAKDLLDEYRKILKDAFNHIREGNINYTNRLAYCLLPDRFPYQIAGNVASKLLNSEMSKGKIVLVMGINREEGIHKVSMRALASHNVNLVEIVSEVCKEIPNSRGGGHILSVGLTAPIEVGIEKLVETIENLLEKTMK